MIIFHLISHFDMGGAERVAANLAMGCDGEAHMVEIMRGNSDFTRSFLRELTAAGVHVHRSWVPDVRWHFLVERLAALLFPLRFLWLYLRHHPDVLHVHTEGPDMCAVLSLTLFPQIRKRVRLVRTIHNTRLWTGQAAIGARVERFYQRHAANVPISQSVLQAYKQAYGEQATTTPIIYNGVPTVPQRPYPHLVKGKTNIIFSGRFEPQKGISTLIEVIRQVATQPHCPYHFHLFGDGSLRAQLVAALGAMDCVSIRPPLPALAEQLASFDYMFMPSEFEGLSMAAIEASMAGLPNIINDAPGLGETLPPDWPLKVQDNSVEAFVHIFNARLPQIQRPALATRAHSFVAARFSLEQMRTEYAKIYSAP